MLFNICYVILLHNKLLVCLLCCKVKKCVSKDITEGLGDGEDKEEKKKKKERGGGWEV